MTRPLISPAQDRDPLPIGQQPLREENDERSLSCSSYRKISHTDDPTR